MDRLVRQPAVFLDKDGTLIEDVPYNVDPERIVLTDGAIEGLTLLANAGYRLVIISNQAGVAHGYFAEEALGAVYARLQALLGAVALGGFYWCPHHPEGTAERYRLRCECRKPQPGLLRRASEELGLHLERSWMVGDILDDIEAGKRAGCRTILVRTAERSDEPLRTPDFRADNLKQAAEQILAQQGVTRDR